MAFMRDVRKRQEKTDVMFEPLARTVELLKSYGISVREETLKQLEEGSMTWSALKKKTLNVREKVSIMQQTEMKHIRQDSERFGKQVEAFRDFFKEKAPTRVAGDMVDVADVEPAYALLDQFHHGAKGAKLPHGSLTTIAAEARALNEKQELFELHVSDYVDLRRSAEDLENLKMLWDSTSTIVFTLDSWRSTLWGEIDTEDLETKAKEMLDLKLDGKKFGLRNLPRTCRAYDLYKQVEDQVKALQTSLPLVGKLKNEAMRPRHWQQLKDQTGKQFTMDEKFSLGDLLALELHKCVDKVDAIQETAVGESKVQDALNKFGEFWGGELANLQFAVFSEGQPDNYPLNLVVPDDVASTLEEHNMALQSLSGNKFVMANPEMAETVGEWQMKLGTVESCLRTWTVVAKKWNMLESVFVGSQDIRQQLPDDSRRFDEINKEFIGLMSDAPDVKNAVEACNMDGRLEQLEEMKKMLAQCEKALQDYLETKRIAFPRFYFVANAALLDILSKGQNPQLIIKYLSTCFDNVHSLKFTEDDKGEPTKTAVTMISGEGEEVPLVDGGCICDGSVEVWLGDLVDAMRKAVWAEFTAALPRYDEAESREDWIMEQGAQNTITVSRTIFTQEINEAFDQIEEGNDNAIRECLDKQKKQLEGLIMVVNRDLKKLDRKKVLTLCTIDVHARDVCQKLIDERVDLAGAFQWQSQLRYGVHEKTRKSVIYVCDAEIDYMYEYIGSPGCLVITPLTDRCYITLTQAQRLVLGGAPAGPAGTGKTETVKDLGRALGIQVYVFNCSDQMDYKAMGQTYKGLAQTGAWGCFDEFNRIPVAVLSVCSTQYKTVLDAIRAKKQKFMFESVEISLRPSIMAFITMNPGYPGRAELPESLKALFRPVSMCVPDLQMICENMLMGEGFLESIILSKKFVILYKLCQDLLSAAPHYDWKLRAIKTTLYVAGGLKRSQPNLTETMVLFQALRDFNLGKLTFDDDGIFRGLLTDLFPGVSVDRQVDFPFEKQIHESGLELMYQVDDSDNLPGAQAAKTFKLKITQLREIFQVRWSVFLLGPAGCGKTAVWKTLMKAQNAFGEKTRMCPINPKAVTRNELYGFLHPTTREWKEGLMSVNFRNFSSQEDVVGEKYKHQWIVLDGDIDAEWIESMNTVMDDNKMLTLASNERLPLTDSMRLLLEINHMLHCSPATVSRGGVIYLNQDDIGWRPMVLSWIEAFHIKDEHFRIAIVNLFDKYLDKALDHCRRNFRTIVPLVPMNIAGSVTKILEGLLPDEPAPGAPPLKPFDEKILEMHFVFAAVWALGGAMFVDSIYDYRKEFHKWWVGTFKDVSFPIDSDDNKARVFDYYVDAEEGRMRPWSEGGKVQDFTYNSSEAFGNIFVPSVESTRLGFLLKSFALRKHYCMFVGNAGTGKTALMKDQLKQLDPDAWTFSTVNMNNSMDAPALQVIMEQPLEKKTGRSYGPPRNRNLVYFFDDMNMPYVDKYDTQSPIEIARQFIDYDGWYDKNEIELKQIQNSQYMACMNPTSGSFTITPRMQRHFVTLAVQMPSTEVLTSIFAKIIEGHLEDFTPEVAKLRTKVAEATIELHAKVTEKFLPSAVKFTHQWNLRELSNITQGLCRSVPEYCQSALTLCRLWVHECERVFSDRMIETKDSNEFNDIRQTLTKKYFPDVDMVALEEKPISFTEFIEAHPNGEDDAFAYAECGSYEKLNKVLVGHLEEYNTSGKATMDLVLFNQAMEHVTRIARVLSLPRGNAMLVGVGGSGKQSLAKLATFICSTATNPMELVQIAVTSSYGMVEFREDLFNMYEKAGKGMRMTFLMTDGQIVNEKFLVYLNDLLSSGFIPDLLTDEQQEQMQNNVRKQCKEAGIQDSNENLFEFFLDMVRKNLHVCLCFSPVGDKFRIRARNFPALVNCTVINAFQPWPHEALVSVAGRFLSEIPELPGNVLESLQFHCAATHQAVTEASEAYRIQDRRYNYTTPKSYLELISLYKTMLAQKREELKAAKERLENGVGKIASAQVQVKDLLIKVNEDKIKVEQSKAETDQLIVSIGKEKAIVDKKVEESAGEEAEAAAKAAECEEINAKATAALAEAQPALDAAAAALNGLDKKALGEYKNNSNPPPPTEQALEAAIILTCRGKFPKDISRPAMQKAVGDVGKFFNMLNNFDAKSPKECPEKVIERIEKDYLKCKATPEEFVRQETGFDAQNIGGKNPAAGGLTDWVVNICKFYRINQVVEPIQIAQRNAQAELDAVNEKLAGVRKIVADLQAKVDGLENNLMVATEAKNDAIAKAEKTQAKADLADRLINGLAGENKRWNDDIARMGREYEKLIGDVMMASSFVSYAGAFNSKFREILVNEKWMPSIVQKEIPVKPTESPMESVLATLASPTTMAQWGIEGLPTDPLSIQNGAIMSNAARWSLMIDPQLQGIAWIKKKYELMPAESLKGEIRIIQLSKPKYINDVEECIKTGTPLIIENLPDDIDAVLDPVVARQTSTKPNGSVVITLGGNELDYDPDFRLYLQTKLSNPHYKPEIAAQTTLVNFCVTEKGLEDQLLALVVEKEREDLQLQSSALVRQLGEFTVQMTGLEDNLLERLKNSQGDILEDIALIENLEETKKTVAEIEDQTEKAKVLQVEIDEKREKYRPVAERGALMYFLIDALSVLDRVYQYSMGNFVYILKKGMQLTPGNESGEPLDGKPLEERVQALIETVSETVYGYVASGLFERHKLIVASQLTFAKLKKEDKLQHAKFQWLLKGSRVSGVENPLAEWIAEPNWQCVQSLKEIEGYDALPGDLEGSAKRWREWMELERPEEEPMPGDWKKYPPFEKLLLFRALRPDRMSNALSTFVRGEMGPFFVTSAAFDLAKSFEDSAPGTPMFIFLSPGVDVAAAVETLGAQLGFSSDNGNYASVSLGQGQESIAMDNLRAAHEKGGWVLLQNIHLTIDWTNGPLEKMVDKLAEGAHEDFRLFLSAEPPPILERGLAISLLQNSIKLTNEPPEGMKQNLARAYGNFTEEMFEACAKQAEFKQIVFALCYFHAAILERKKFGVGNMPDAASGIGWNMNYPFNTGDLLCCGQCVNNYLENNSNVPWDDIKYIIGEIMYGGHVVEDWDRRTVEMYLNHYFKEELLEGLDFFPKFPAPPSNLNHKQTMEYIAETFPTESPLAFGLHPNAEIGFKLREAESLCASVLSLQPRDGGGEGGASTEHVAREALVKLTEILEGKEFDMEDIRKRAPDPVTPYVMVAIQEAERMNVLLAEISRSLTELSLGLEGKLTMSNPMEELMYALAEERIYAGWVKLAYPSLRGLTSWTENLCRRIEQLQIWTGDLELPKVVWISGLFNPQSFLTAVMQTTARRNEWALDKTAITTEVTKKTAEQVEAPSRDGAFVHGLTLEGCRWNDVVGVLEESAPKEMFCEMPVMTIKAVVAEKAEARDAYQCPVYKTERRFREEVFTAQLKSKHGQIKWTLCGVCLFLDVV
jgi:dynein heavy chain